VLHTTIALLVVCRAIGTAERFAKSPDLAHLAAPPVEPLTTVRDVLQPARAATATATAFGTGSVPSFARITRARATMQQSAAASPHALYSGHNGRGEAV
jgi:hypothetical protein